MKEISIEVDRLDQKFMVSCNIDFLFDFLSLIRGHNDPLEHHAKDLPKPCVFQSRARDVDL